ncbi:MAG: cation transporter, partial [Lachnospiraceae bacterium]|nr:cation transporter [Lachnospiraceae bacterium]
MADNNKLKFNIQGMSCAACVARVDKATRETEGVVDCSVNLLTNSMEVTLSEGISSQDDKKSDGAESNMNQTLIARAIADSVSKAGYKAIEVATDIDSEEKVKNINDSYKRDINNHIARLVSSGVLLLLLMYVAMGHHMFGLPLPQILIDNPLIGAVIQAILCFAVMCINHKFFINGAK